MYTYIKALTNRVVNISRAYSCSLIILANIITFSFDFSLIFILIRPLYLVLNYNPSIVCMCLSVRWTLKPRATDALLDVAYSRRPFISLIQQVGRWCYIEMSIFFFSYFLYYFSIFISLARPKATTHTKSCFISST